MSPSDSKSKIQLPTKLLADYTRPAYSITAYKSQGSTIRKAYSIYDWENMTDRTRYVALSRGTTIKNVNIIRKKRYDEPEEPKRMPERFVMPDKAIAPPKAKYAKHIRSEDEIHEAYLKYSKRLDRLLELKAEIMQVRDETAAGNATYCSNVFPLICKAIRKAE